MAREMKRCALGCALVALLCGCASPATRPLKSTVELQRQAEQAYANGHLDQALADYQSLAREVPLHADFWFRLGNIHVRMKQPEQAVDAYEHALRLEPGHAKAWHNVGIVRLRQAEAAFGQSARYAAAVEPSLQQQSAQMAHALAAIGDAPSDSSPPAASVEQGPRP